MKLKLLILQKNLSLRTRTPYGIFTQLFKTDTALFPKLFAPYPLIKRTL